MTNGGNDDDTTIDQVRHDTCLTRLPWLFDQNFIDGLASRIDYAPEYLAHMEEWIVDICGYVHRLEDALRKVMSSPPTVDIEEKIIALRLNNI